MTTENTDSATEADPVADQATEAAEADQATDQTVDQTSDQAGDGEQPKDREAARYRKRLRDTETERDRLAERLTVMQRADAERQAGQRLGKGADLWAGGVELSSLINEAGELDAELIDQAVTGVIAEHPHWKRTGVPSASMITANDKIGAGPGNTFTDAFRPPDKR